MVRALFYLCTLCVVIQLTLGIVSKSDGENKSSSVETVKEAARENLGRKSDYLGQASFDHSHYQLPGGDFGGGSYGGGGYGYGGGLYGDHHHEHHDHHHLSHHDAALKGLLVPLAGVALLGAAALFASNPVLLQLGVVAGKRRRREIAAESIDAEKFRDIQALEKFIDQIPKAQVMKQEKRLLASYLQCSGVAEYDNRCIERLSCEIQSPSANVTQLERQVLDIVTSDIMKNEYIPDGLKQRINKAKMIGVNKGKCDRYFCSEIDL